MSCTAILSETNEELHEVSEIGILPVIDNDFDFVEIFPPELSNKLFTYISDKDLFSCSKCSISWRQVINNNPQWKWRCIRRGWISSQNESKNPEKWNLVKSHVSKKEVFRFRTSPAFDLHSVIINLRIPPLCDWVLYFRQCLHLKRNWTKGIYAVHRMTIENEEIYEPMVINATDCNGNVMATGTHGGQVLLWSVEGVPKYIKCIWPMLRRAEVEAIRLRSKYLVILYNLGVIRIFNAQKEPKTGDYKFDILYQIRGIGSHSPDGFEFNLNAESLPVDEILPQAGMENDEDVELWIRDLFRAEFWFGNDELGSDMMIYANEECVVLTALLCKYFILWDIHTGVCRPKSLLKSGFQVFFECYLSSRKLYVSARKRNVEDAHTYSLLVYDIHELVQDKPEKLIEISSDLVIEETRADSKDERIVYSTQDGVIHGMHLVDKSILFTKNATSFVDNLTVTDTQVVYHQYDGCLVGLNWNGETLYEIKAHIGLVKGLKCFGNLLVSGGDAMQLSVWDVSTGEKLHTVHHQPCRIQYLYADETKIVTVGREDHPVLIGYW